MTEEQEELKLCPIDLECAYINVKIEPDYFYNHYFIRCSKCYLQTAKYESKSEAIEMWNRRA